MFILERNPKSIVSESYRTLRTNIQYSSFDKQIKSILITSAQSGEGKSTVSGNLALSFAQNEKYVILVDCDLRKPSVHKNFKLSNLVGLSDVLVGKEELESAIQKYSKGLSILTSGKETPNPSEMLSSKSMSELLEILGSKYDIVILDSSPITAVTDAQILSTKVDGTILVVRSSKTKSDTIIEAKELLNNVGANIIGVILNSVKYTKRNSYYYGSRE